MDQGFTNFTEHPNHSRILANTHPDSGVLGWAKSLSFFLTSPQVMRMLGPQATAGAARLHQALTSQKCVQVQ